MGDTSNVDAAILAKLSGDATLIAICPVVGWDIVAPEATKFVIVSQVDHEDAYVMPGRTVWERILYLVKAVTLGTSGTEVKNAAARIHTLLQDGTLAPEGYTLMNMQRVTRVRATEIDETTNQRWSHRGGHYEVMVCPK
jgi:hypothetical protein